MGKTMSEENVRRIYETIARIVSDRENVKVKLVGIKKKEESGENKQLA